LEHSQGFGNRNNEKKGMEKFPTKVGGDHSLNNISSGGEVRKVIASHYFQDLDKSRASFNKWRLGFNFHKIQEQVKSCKRII